MKKYQIVKEHDEFDSIIKTGRYNKNKFYILYNKDSKLPYPRFGIAVGKKNGNAVLRNKLKRQIRMIITNNKNLFKNGKDYIIIVKKASIDLSYEEKQKELLSLIENR